MTFEFFKAYPPDRDSAVVELNVRHGSTIDVPVEIRWEEGQLRIAIFGREGGVAWDYLVEEWMEAIRSAIEVLGTG